MLCQNCGKNEVNFRYTQVINGVKKEMALCDKCAKSLGLESLDFNMPINFSSFLGDFFDEGLGLLPSFTKQGTIECDNCGMTYDEFINTGKFGCSNCYDVFSEGLNNVLKNIHGSDTHVGRRSRLTSAEKNKVKEDVKKARGEKNKANDKNVNDKENDNDKNEINQNAKASDLKKKNQENEKQGKIKNLNISLKQAIKEERYEDAAKIRDEIKELEK